MLTLVRHLGYSWSPGRTLNEMGTLSARRLAQKASQMARCTALYTTSRPVKATKAMGRQHSSGGSSHWEPAMVMVQQWKYLHKTEQWDTNSLKIKCLTFSFSTIHLRSSRICNASKRKVMFGDFPTTFCCFTFYISVNEKICVNQSELICRILIC